MQITVKEAAARMGVCTKTIFRRISSGEIAACKYGETKCSPVRIDEADLQAYIDAHKTGERKEAVSFRVYRADSTMRPENQ